MNRCMITFVCKGCGKRHTRSDHQAGLLVFCDCGCGMRVPLNAPESQPPRLEAVPVLEAIAVSESQPIVDALPVVQPPPLPSLPTRWKPSPVGKVHPSICFHHDRVPKVGHCEDCRLPFCEACLIDLHGRQLCGPCKNFRLADLALPRRLHPLAVLSLILGIATVPLTLALTLIGFGLALGEGLPGLTILLSLVGALFPTLALAVAGLTMRRLQSSVADRGRTLTAAGACLALVSLLWCLTVALLIVGKHSPG